MTNGLAEKIRRARKQVPADARGDVRRGLQTFNRGERQRVREMVQLYGKQRTASVKGTSVVVINQICGERDE
jgi:hypothetical protein